MKKLAITIFLLSSASACFSQAKFPVYIFGLSQQQCDGLRASNANRLLHFFSDSTFTVSNYKWVSTLPAKISKTIDSGRFVQRGDTLFLTDFASPFSLHKSKENYFESLAKDGELLLFPAIITLKRGNIRFVSFLNISKQLQALSYFCVADLEAKYYQFSGDKSVNKFKEILDLSRAW